MEELGARGPGAGRGRRGWDVTSEAVVPASARARARIVQKQQGVLFGLDAAAEAFAQSGAEGVDRLVSKANGATTCPRKWRSSRVPRALLTAERTALNFLAHLSGIAT